MPAKSGGSHAIAAFLSIVIGALISNFLSAHTGLFRDASQSTGSAVTDVLGLGAPGQVVGLLVIAMALSFGWGVAYHYARQRSADENGPNAYARSRKQLSSDMTATPNGSGTHRATGGRAVGTTADEDTESQLPDALAAVIPDHSYATVGDATATDETVRSVLSNRLSSARSTLADAHDDLYDADRRADSERVTEIRDAIETFDRRIGPDHATQTGVKAVPGTGEAARAQLREHDAALVVAAEDLQTAASTAREAARTDPGETGDALDECERVVERLEATFTERRTGLETTE